MSELEKIGKVIETDVLVIGGGIAGACVAIRAKEFPVEVTLVDKGSFGRSGCSAVSSGAYQCYLPGDDFELWYKEYIDAGVPLVDQRTLKNFIRGTAEMVRRMDEWGVKWVKDDGKFVRSKAHGDTVPRAAMMAGGGPQFMSAIRDEALRRGVVVKNKIMITGLLTSDGKNPTEGKVVGAIGFHVQTGDIHIFNAKATILACGGPNGLPYAKLGQPFSAGLMPNNLTADGDAMALGAGAELVHMDLGLMESGLHFANLGCAPSMNILFGLGAKLTNSKGELFMERYDPVKKESAHRWVTGVAVAKEIREGRGPVVLDCTHFTPEKFKLCRVTIPIIMNTFDAAGYDLTKDKIEYVTDIQGANNGTCGVLTNEGGGTSIEGLYAAGASTMVPIRALPGCSISGWLAGESAAKYALGTERPEIVKGQAERMKGDILEPLNVKDGLEFDEVQEKISEILDVNIGVFLHEDRLRKANEKISELKNSASRMLAKDPHELSKVLGIRNYIEVLDVMVRAARRRRESRDGFVREDYPETDNISWLKWIVCKYKDEEIKFWEEPIPVEDWEMPVEREKITHMIFR